MSFNQSPLNEPKKAPPSINKRVRATVSRDSDLTITREGLDPALYLERHYCRKGDSTGFYTPMNASAAVGAVGPYVSVFVDGPYTLTHARDEKGQKVEVRNREIGEAPDGSPIFSGFLIDGWRFCEEFFPDKSWMVPSEWNAILEELRPILEREKEYARLDREASHERNRKQNAAAESRQNPEASLAKGIASGVAEALRNLGIQPKEGGAQ